MENKDLSRDFAIIFGIKPEEVPNNSSGNKKDFSALADEVFANLRKLGFGENIIQEKPNEKRENSTVKSIKMDKSHRQVFEEQVDELIKHSEMENSKTDENYKLVTGMDAALLGENDARKDDLKTAKVQTDEKQIYLKKTQIAKFLKIDKDGVWFDAIFTNGNPLKPGGGKLILKLEDYSNLGYEVIGTEIEQDRLNDLIDKGVLKVHRLENY